MIPSSHPLIEAVTEPLADDAERRMAANTLLGETLDPGHPGVAETTARLEAAGRRKFPVWRMALPWSLAALALATVAFTHFPMIRMSATILDHDLFDPWEKPTLPQGLTLEQRLLLGDPDMDELEQKRRLHSLSPENPAYYAEYAQAYLSEHESLPPDFLETAARITPDNAFFPYFYAGRIVKDAITKKKRSGTSPPPRFVKGVRLSPFPSETEFDINDTAAFGEALAMVSKATAMPGYETYTNEMIAARVRLLPSRNMAEFTRSLIYAYSTSSGIIHLRYVADLFCARAEELSKDGKKGEFLALAAQREAFIAHLGRNPDKNLIGELVHAVIAAATAKNFQVAADRLGLADMAETYRKQSDAFVKERDTREFLRNKEPDPFPEDKSSSITRLALPMVGRQVNDPPSLGDADLEPMRMAEHELLGGLGVLAVALVMPLAALIVFLFRFAFAPMFRLPAKRMAGVLGVADWLCVIAFGVAAPILAFLLVTRLTPLGGRAYGAPNFLFAFPGVHLVALLLGLLIAPAIAVRWRLAKRLEPLGLRDRFTVPLSLAVLAMLLAWSLAALPGLERFGMEKFSLIALAAPPALCLGILFANVLRAILGKPASRFNQCTATVAVLPAYPIAVIALCALMPLYSSGEKHWLAKERLLRIDPDAADLGAYEFKVAAQKRREINAITGVGN